MLKIDVTKCKNIEQAIKKLRRKVKTTKQYKKLRDARYYIKKSERRRKKLDKAIDLEKWKLDNED